MEQILIIQPPSSQAPQSSSGPQDAQNDFSPHLEAALDSKNNNKINAKEQESTNRSQVESSGPESTANSETLAASNSESNESTDVVVNNVSDPSFPTTQINYSATFQLSQEISNSAGQVEQLRAVSNFSMDYYYSGNKAAADSSATNASGVLQSFDNTINQEFSQSEIDSALQTALKQQALPGKSNTAASQITAQPLTQEQDKILTQLQQIIDNSSETGKVTISQSTNLASSYSSRSSTTHPGFLSNFQQQLVVDASGGTPSASLTVSTYLSPDELNLNPATGNKQNQDLTGLRLDTNQQFYDAKLGEQSGNQTSSNNSEDKSSLNQFGQQTGTSGQLGATSANTEQTNTFAQVVGGTQGIETPTAGETVKPIVPLVHNLAHEQEVLQQLIDKFQINRRKPQTNLNIKLHPAELGELKIDLTVKEGSIRANVLAQSQHVQEILEKNMLKLKTVLEDQGFTVDEINIASKSDSVGDFDLFDNHLFNRQNDTSAPQKNTHKNSAGFQLEESEPVDEDTISGVNVTA